MTSKKIVTDSFPMPPFQTGESTPTVIKFFFGNLRTAKISTHTLDVDKHNDICIFLFIQGNRMYGINFTGL